MSSDYFGYQSRKQGAGKPKEVPDREEPAAPSEPIEVREHTATTSIIQKLRLSRFWNDKRN